MSKYLSVCMRSALCMCKTVASSHISTYMCVYLPLSMHLFNERFGRGMFVCVFVCLCMFIIYLNNFWLAIHNERSNEQLKRQQQTAERYMHIHMYVCACVFVHFDFFCCFAHLRLAIFSECSLLRHTWQMFKERLH